MQFNRSGTTGEPLSDDPDKGPRRERLAEEFIEIAFDTSATAREYLRNDVDRAAQ